MFLLFLFGIAAVTLVVLGFQGYLGARAREKLADIVKPK